MARGTHGKHQPYRRALLGGQSARTRYAGGNELHASRKSRRSAAGQRHLQGKSRQDRAGGSAELAPRSCRYHPQISVSPRQPRDGSHSLILSTRPGCCRVSPPQPLFESSVQGPNLLVTTIQEHARQTGARSLIGSRAVKDYFLLRRQAVYVLNKLRRRDSQGSGHRHVGTQKGVFGAQIHDQNFIP